MIPPLRILNFYRSGELLFSQSITSMMMLDSSCFSSYVDFFSNDSLMVIIMSGIPFLLVLK